MHNSDTVGIVCSKILDILNFMILSGNEFCLFLPCKHFQVCWGKGTVLTKTTEKSCKVQFTTLKLRDIGTNSCKN